MIEVNEEKAGVGRQHEPHTMPEHSWRIRLERDDGEGRISPGKSARFHVAVNVLAGRRTHRHLVSSAAIARAQLVDDE